MNFIPIFFRRLTTRSKNVQSLLILLIVVLPCSAITAQPTVSGRIIDARTEQPLIGANIVQLQTDKGATTGKDGHFTLQLQSDAPRILRVSYIGYKTKRIPLQERSSPLEIRLLPKTLISDAVFVQALRVDEASPITYQNISEARIREKNQGQNMPYLLQNMTSVTTSSNGGAGIGYTSMRIRGIGERHINVTINGIPLNDAESHGVFWVDIPNLAASVENIQIQRGVGTSTNGAAAFGATINLKTTQLQSEPYGVASISAGSFDTQKYNLEVGSGLIGDWQFNVRLSKISSQGYIDRAFSDLRSFYASVSRYGERSLFSAIAFSGHERTYQAWYGVPEDSLDTHRTYNPAGQEKSGSPYENQVDNYQQDHYQLHYSYRIAEGWNANVSLHMTYGHGFYEEYKAKERLKNYDISPVTVGDTTIRTTDLIRQRWLENWFYGTVFSSTYSKPERWQLTVGGGYNEYDGRHFGKVIWARFAGNSELDGPPYYDNDSFKTDFNLYTKFRYNITDRLLGYADLQYRSVTYDFLGKDIIDRQSGGKRIINLRQHDALYFWNPKGGFTYKIAPGQRAYASLAVAHREPARNQYVNSTPENRPKPEKLYDWEVGYRGEFDRWSGQVNLYYMRYHDQLIRTGEVNDVGAYVRQNVDRSYRLGLELQGGVRLSPRWSWQGNFTLSRNKIEEYTQYITNYDTGQQIARHYENTTISFSPKFIGNSRLKFQIGAFQAEWISKYVSRQYLDNTQTLSRSIDPYWIQNLLLQYRFDNLSPLPTLTATLQINNLTNQMYETGGYTYGFISGGQEIHREFYYPQAGRNFLFEVRMAI